MSVQSMLKITGVSALAAALLVLDVAAQWEVGCTPLVRPIGTSTTANLELATPIPAPDLDIAGTAALTYDPGTEPAVEKVGIQITGGGNFGTRTYELFIENGSAALVSVGLLEWDGNNEEVGSFEITQEDAGFAAFLALLDADNTSDLQARLLEIRQDGTTTVLLGAIPILGSNSLTGSVDPTTLPKGLLDMRRNGAAQSVEINVENVRVLDTAYYLFVETAIGSDVYQYVDNLEPRERQPTTLSHKIVYRAHTRRGDPLPLGVTDITDLVGRHFMVVDDDLDTVVEGLFPALAVPGAPGGTIQASAPMVQPEFYVADSTAFGSLRVTYRPKANTVTIDLQVHMRMQANFASGEGRVFVELSPGARVFNEVGWLYDVRAAGKVNARLKIATGDGEPLPLGEFSYDNLVGREIQVRDPGGYLYLRGIFPALPAPGVRLTSRFGAEALTNADPLNFPGAQAMTAVKYNERRGDAELQIRAQGLPPNQTYEVWLWDARLSAFSPASNLFFPDTRGVKIRTKRGTPLPLGILAPEDLIGLQIRIYAQGGGMIFDGVLPSF